MYQRILVPLDGSPTAERGLREAIRLASGHHTHLILLHVIGDCPTMGEFASTEPFDDMRARRRREAEQMLEPAREMAQGARVTARTEICFPVESVPDSILETAKRVDCDLIVTGTHGRGGVRRAVLGSVAEAVARHSPVPVLLVPPQSEAHAAPSVARS
jgi:nucleotide-binding universal stress UspA family protein